MNTKANDVIYEIFVKDYGNDNIFSFNEYFFSFNEAKEKFYTIYLQLLNKHTGLKEEDIGEYYELIKNDRHCSTYTTNGSLKDDIKNNPNNEYCEHITKFNYDDSIGIYISTNHRMLKIILKKTPFLLNGLILSYSKSITPFVENGDVDTKEQKFFLGKIIQLETTGIKDFRVIGYYDNIDNKNKILQKYIETNPDYFSITEINTDLYEVYNDNKLQYKLLCI